MNAINLRVAAAVRLGAWHRHLWSILPVCRFQSFVVPSYEADMARWWCSGWHSRICTEAWWPRRRCTSCPVWASHTLMVWSLTEEMTYSQTQNVEYHSTALLVPLFLTHVIGLIGTHTGKSCTCCLRSRKDSHDIACLQAVPACMLPKTPLKRFS